MLGGALGAVLGMFHMNRLPLHNHPLFDSTRFERATDDRFFISIDSTDPRFSESATPDLLRKAGVAGLEWVSA